MNNKGQSLVVFVILLPILLILMAFSIDIGYQLIEKSKLVDINKTAITYLVKDKKDQNTIKEVIAKNDKEIKIEKITQNRIKLTKNINSVFGKLVKLKTYKITSDLSGRLENNKLIIEKGQ